MDSEKVIRPSEIEYYDPRNFMADGSIQAIAMIDHAIRMAETGKSYSDTRN